MPETKSELKTIVENLRKQQDWNRHDADSLRRLIVDMLKEQRTLQMRYDWLEEAARDVCTACEDHVPEFIGRLADEIGIEITEDQNNGDT